MAGCDLPERPVRGVARLIGCRRVENAQHIPAFTGRHQSRIAQIAKAFIGGKFIKMMAVQMDAMRKGGIIHECNTYRFAAFDGGEGRVRKVRDIVEGPDVGAAVPPAHGTAHHGQRQVLGGGTRCREVRCRQGRRRPRLPIRILARDGQFGQTVRLLSRGHVKADRAGDFDDQVGPLGRRQNEVRGRAGLAQCHAVQGDNRTRNARDA